MGVKILGESLCIDERILLQYLFNSSLTVCFTVLFYSNSLGMITLSMVFSVLLHNLAKSKQPDHKVPKYITQLLKTKFGTVMRFTSMKVNIIIRNNGRYCAHNGTLKLYNTYYSCITQDDIKTLNFLTVYHTILLYACVVIRR